MPHMILNYTGNSSILKNADGGSNPGVKGGVLNSKKVTTRMSYLGLYYFFYKIHHA
jgi:hypothetical protein